MRTYVFPLDPPAFGVRVSVDVVKRYLFIRASTIGMYEGLIRMTLEGAREEDMRSIDFAYTSYAGLPTPLRDLATRVCSDLRPRGLERGRVRAKRFMYSVMNDLLLRIAVAEYQESKRRLGETTEVTR